MFSQSFEYALRCLVHLAKGQDRVQSIGRIAAAMEIPKDYLYKLVPPLHRTGLVSTTRGKYGGIRLDRSADTITMFDVLVSVEPWERLRGCPLTNRRNCARTGANGRFCELHDLLDQLADTIERRLKSVTLGDFLQEGNVALAGVTPLLSSPWVPKRKRPLPRRKS